MLMKGEAEINSQRGITMVEVVIVIAMSMVMAALTSQSMQSAVNVYQMSRSARQVVALVQQARIFATGKNTRYQLSIDTANRQYRIRYCSASSGLTCTGWTDDLYSGPATLPKGVSFDASGITVIPPDQASVSLATDFTFNTMGLLWDETGGALSNGRCTYLQANGLRPLAVCAGMTGKTTLYRLTDGIWQQQ